MSTGTRDLPSALAAPGFYQHAPERVLVHETHISWVFVAGELAYKLKKPVRLPFLDYGTRRRRRAMCRREVLLNRRLAPELYLGVRAVVEDARGLALGDEDDPRAVDYLVEMRRYDERATLASRLARGELRRADVADVGQALARFHQRASRVRTGVQSARVRSIVGENCRELADLVAHRPERLPVLALERFASSFIAATADTLDRRAHQGLVRDVHGDLRAEHVLVDGSVQIVDCIEFDTRLRRLDVADDLAFLVMDLTHRGGEGYVQALLDGYAAGGGAPCPPPLLAFYAMHRALVRAKVELLRAAEAQPGSALHGRHSAAARELTALAERFAWRARTPLVLVVCGVPAAGKSQLARALAAASGFAHLSSDVVRKRLAGVRLHERGPPELYDEEWNRRTYARLGELAAGQAHAHGGAIVDATFRRRADRDAFAAAFAGGAPAVFVECRAPAAVLAERAARRQRARTSVSDASLAVVMRERLAWEPLDELAPDAHVAVRSDRPPDDILADLAALLDQRLTRGWAVAAGTA